MFSTPIIQICEWHATSDRVGVDVATATSFVGPFGSKASRLLLSLVLGSDIDPYYEKSGKTRYVIYTNDGNCYGYTETLLASAA